MELAPIVTQYQRAFEARYGARVLPSQRRAIDAMLRCGTPESGQMLLRCDPCQVQLQQPHSCGHRACPKCQNHQTTQWLERQQAKLLPVEYFMVTFTVPFELRHLAWTHQRLFYDLLFEVVSATLKDFGLNPEHLGAALGLTAILHTHTRRLDYHPHLHVVVPGGGVNRTRRCWKKTRGRFLFNQQALARVFRARLLAALCAAGLTLPRGVPEQWVVQCLHVGRGQGALQYLSRYLYRGVISEANIIANENGQVTFKYIESNTGLTRYRPVPGEQFLWLLLQHVLPKGFRRVRDYGFLHGNARKLLHLIQLILQVRVPAFALRPRPKFRCPRCQEPMHIVAFIRPNWQPG